MTASLPHSAPGFTDGDAVRWFQTLARRCPDAVIVLDGAGRASFASASVARWLDCTPEEVSTARLMAALHPEDRCPLAQRLAAGPALQARAPVPIRIRRPDQPMLYAEVSVLAPEDDRGEVLVYARNVTRERTRDALTGLVNRTRLAEAVDATLGHGYGLVVVNMDRFEDVLHRLGHAVGQRVIRTCAKRIEGSVGDDHVVARLEGVSFAVLIPGAPGLSTLEALSERIQTELERPIQLIGRLVKATASVGIVESHESLTSADHVLRAAHVALHRARQGGQRQRSAYEPGMLDSAEERLAIESDLRQAIDLDELALHYQPVIENGTGRIVAFEALLRWFHPTRGFISPALIVDIAVQAGLMLDLGHWVLLRACRQVREWSSDPAYQHLVVNINLAAEQLTQGDLLAEVEEVIAETGVNPRQLNFEVTETSIIANPEAAAHTLSEIRRREIKLSLDDFGTGYSSLNYLHRFEFDSIKIDRSFISDIGTERHNERQMELVRTIVRLGQGLDLKVVAEGIETREQLEFLQKEGCSHGQGYYFSRPLPPEAAIALLGEPSRDADQGF